MRRAVLELILWRGKRVLVLALILVELILIPSHPVNSYPAWTLRRVNSTITFLRQTSMRRRRRCSMKMEPWTKNHRGTGSSLQALEVPKESLTAPSDLAQKLNSATDLIQGQADWEWRRTGQGRIHCLIIWVLPPVELKEPSTGSLPQY